MSIRSIFLACAGLAFLPWVTAGADWPAWRGGEQNGRSGEAIEFSAGDGLRVAWKRALGTGYSGISVAGNHAVTMFGDRAYDFVISLDAASGKEQWRYRIGPTFHAPVQSNDGPLSTPAIAAGRVFALGPRGKLVALDLATGHLLWAHDLVAEYAAPLPYFGFATSPLVANGLVLLQAGVRHASLLAFDAQTGARVWSSGEDTVTYQTPVLANLLGERQIVFAGDQYVFGARIETGEVLWMREHGVRADPDAVKQVLLGPGDLNPICPVVIGDDRVLLSNYYSPTAVLFGLTRQSGKYVVTETWRNRNMRKTYTVPVALGSRIFGFSWRFPVCIDAQTGDILWQSRAPGDSFLIAVGDLLVYLTKDDGSIHLARQSTEGYVELASETVFDDLTWTPPSYTGGRIFARNFREIAAVEVDRRHPETAASARPSRQTAAESPFGRLLERLAAAPVESREKLVDEFFASQKQFPIIEGDRTAHIVFRGREKDIAIEGDLLEVGDQAPMKHVEGTTLYYASFELEPDARVDYRFSRNFNRTSTADPLNPRKVTLPTDVRSEIAMPRWTAPAYLTGTQSAGRGTVEHIEFESQVKKAICGADVYLPSGYFDNSNRYPALYIPNGKEAGRFGQFTLALDWLISAGRIRPILAVLIDGENRPEEFVGSGRDRYAEMVARELIPRIDGKYRTLTDPSGRAIYGADKAGFAAVYAAFRYPGTFGMVAGQSTYLFGPVGGDDLLQIVRASPTLGISFYFGWGTHDFRGRGVQRRLGMMDWRKDSLNLVALLQEKGYRVRGAENHQGWGWSSWRNFIGEILEHFFS